jgi:hypothetical protein
MNQFTAQVAGRVGRTGWVLVLGVVALSVSSLTYAGTGGNKSTASSHRGTKHAASLAAKANDARLLIVPGENVVIAFSTMYGVDGPFVGEDHPVRNIIGDELPWSIESAVGALDAEGHLTVRVRGLVFKDDPSVPPELRGINDESQFRAVVSCLGEGATDTPVENVATAGFAATPAGDADIATKVELPNPCIAPIVMILAGSEDKWFAITGVEVEED